MTRQVFLTPMVAHIWAQGSQEEGRNSARRVFFEGPRLYSYGRHFLTGYLCPDLSAFINSDHYSISTSGHQWDARRAVKGATYHCPDLAGLADLMDSLFRRDIWLDSNGAEKDSPYDDSGQYIGGNRGQRAATKKEAAALRPRILEWFIKANETAPADTIRAALIYAGAKPEEAAKAAAKVEKIHAKRAADQKALRAKTAKQEAAKDARSAAARPLSDFAAKVESARADLKGRGSYRGAWEREAAGLLESTKRLFRARKEAKAKGWTRLCADLLAREKVLRQGAAGLESYSDSLARLGYWKEKKEGLREGLAALQPGGPAFSAYDWQRRRGMAESLLAAIQAGALNEGGRHWLPSMARLMGADLGRMAAGLSGIIEAMKGAESRAKIVESRESRRKEIQTLRAWKAARPEDLAAWIESHGFAADKAPAALAEAAANVASRYALVTYDSAGLVIHQPAIPACYTLAGFTRAAFASIRDKAREKAAALKIAESAAKIEAWREGSPAPFRLSDSQGGAMLRARSVTRDESGAINGGLLETSHGASVPLPHALRAFRFLKLCRESGKAWRANGKSLSVGHFKVDSIDQAGNFRAGCHAINWPEVAALAARLGVDSLAPADTTESRA